MTPFSSFRIDFPLINWVILVFINPTVYIIFFYLWIWKIENPLI